MTTEKLQEPIEANPAVGGLLARLQAVFTATRKADEDCRACEGVGIDEYTDATTRALLRPIIANPLKAAGELASLAVMPGHPVTVTARTEAARVKAIGSLRTIVELLEAFPDQVDGLCIYETVGDGGAVSVHIVARTRRMTSA